MVIIHTDNQWFKYWILNKEIINTEEQSFPVFPACRQAGLLALPSGKCQIRLPASRRVGDQIIRNDGLKNQLAILKSEIKENFNKLTNKTHMKYVIYARKSSEDEDRQVLSIEAQITELKEFAAKEKLEIV